MERVKIFRKEMSLCYERIVVPSGFWFCVTNSHRFISVLS